MCYSVRVEWMETSCDQIDPGLSGLACSWGRSHDLSSRKLQNELRQRTEEGVWQS